MKIKYKLENIIDDKSVTTPSEIIKKIDDFLCVTQSFDEKYGGNFNTVYCGQKIYTYLQMSSKYKFEKNERDVLEFPVFFGTWVNEEQTIFLYFSPDKCEEDECIILNTEIETLTNEIEQSLPKFEETKIEEAGYTKNVEEWLEFIKEPRVDRVGEYIFDYEIIKNAEAFGLGPVFCYNGKTEACWLIEYDSLNDMKDFLKGKKYLVYYILCQVISGSIGAIETKDLFITFKDNFLPIDRIGKNPKIRYIFRGHILE